MLTYIVRRILYSIPVLIVSTFLSFMFVSLAGQPGRRRCAANPRFPPNTLHNIFVQNHLDRSIPVRYWYWVEDVFTHKLGNSLSTFQPIWPDITRTLGHTAQFDHHLGVARDSPRRRRRHLLGDPAVLDLRLLVHVVQLPRLRDADVLARAAAADPLRRHLPEVERADLLHVRA